MIKYSMYLGPMKSLLGLGFSFLGLRYEHGYVCLRRDFGIYLHVYLDHESRYWCSQGVGQQIGEF